MPHWVLESPVPSLGSVSITDAAMQQIRAGKFDFFSGGDEYALALKQVPAARLFNHTTSPL